MLVTPLRIDRDILNELECHLMLCYTGQVRLGLGLVEAQMRSFAEQRQQTVAAMRQIHEHAYTMMEALLHGQLTRFGELLDQAYQAKLEMNPHISNDRIDHLYQTAKRSGAVGGKLCGAGGGGYLLLYVPGARQHDVRRALEQAGGQIVRFAFEERGLQTWRSQCR